MTTRLVLALSLLSGAVVVRAEVGVPAHEAIVNAVRARMGADAGIVVEPIGIEWSALPPAEDALFEPGATLGGPISVLLRASVVRGGAATLAPVARVRVRLQVEADHWHTTRAVPRGAMLDTADVGPARHVIATGAIDRLPSRADVVGAAALRDLPTDACVTGRAVRPMPAVRAGDPVAAVFMGAGLEVRAGLVAVDAGRIGVIVRVRHPETKRTLRARVVGRGEVEVVR